MELRADRRQRDVDDRDVEHRHEEGDANECERLPAARIRSRCSSRLLPRLVPFARKLNGLPCNSQDRTRLAGGHGCETLVSPQAGRPRLASGHVAGVARRRGRDLRCGRRPRRAQRQRRPDPARRRSGRRLRDRGARDRRRPRRAEGAAERRAGRAARAGGGSRPASRSASRCRVGRPGARRREPDQALRRPGRRRRPLLQRRRGRGLRLPGAQRRGQDHDGSDAGDADRADVRLGARRRNPAGAGARGRDPAAHRGDARESGPLPPSHA